MAKFCGKCGTKLDEVTGLCPNCDAEQIKKQIEQSAEQPKPAMKNDKLVQQQELSLSKKEAKKKCKAEKKATKKVKKKEKWAEKTLGQKLKSMLFKTIIWILLVCFLFVFIVGLLTYYGILEIPILDKVMDKVGIEVGTQNVERTTPETNTMDFSLYPSSEKNIIVDKQSGFVYFNNEILVTLVSKNEKANLEIYLESIGGHVVGEIPEIAEYQILLDEEYTYNQLMEYVDIMEGFDWVISASPNYALKMDASYIPNDREWKSKWGDFPEGINWGVEAIDADEAWEYQNEMERVNVGVIDTMFDLNHEDLVFAEKPLGTEGIKAQMSEGKRDWDNHGSHTAGTIAASFDNKKGIAGVSPTSNLYGVSIWGIEASGYSSLQAWKISLYYLIAVNNCKVINISMGEDQLTFEASRKGEIATFVLKGYADELGKFLHSLIDLDYEFVICKSAGNQNEVGGDYQYFKKDFDDTSTPYDYYSYSDYLKYLKGESGYEYFERYKDRQEEIKSKLESGNVDADYDIMGMITDIEVKKRIIVVGAVQNLGTHKEGGTVHDGYEIAAFSQCGKRVDVLAPGVDIYSTVKEGYEEKNGTSMAAPHVAGVAALVFSLNPDFEGSQVKEIICDTATGQYGNNKYGLINANAAVKAAKNVMAIEPPKSEGKFEHSNIPDGAVEFNGHYYYVFCKDDITNWNDAKAFCKSQSGYLATITSQEENDFLYSYITQEGYSSAYFGLSDEEAEGIWLWDNGEEASYTNWHYNEPNGETSSEDYALFYYKYSDGTWNDGDFENRTVNSGTAFICEWGEYEIASKENSSEPIRATSDERDIVLVLDTSGSMSGTPLEETKKASVKFVNTILEEDASIGVVTYDDKAEQLSDFSVNKNHLRQIVTGISDGGGTNIGDGLAKAKSMLDKSQAKKKMIVLMSDGEPNQGKEGEELIAYANELKNSGIYLYTLGFFEDMGDKKSSAQYLMEEIASDGCHYEVANADDLVFFFEDIADQINGQKYIYVRIACPVDVSVTYKGETLNSSEKNPALRTKFGTLTFEENQSTSSQGEEDKVKILRLKEGADYDIQIEGTGYGVMDYTIGFMDENGEYSDFRKFENIKITKQTMIDTVAADSDESVLKIDEDGDGKYDLKLSAEENGYGKEVKTRTWIYIVIGSGVLLLIIDLFITLKMRKKRKGKVSV